MGLICTLDELIEEHKAIYGNEIPRSCALTNGVFDILHVGHIRLLEAAAKKAGYLVIAVNSDSSTQRLKGSRRPIVPLVERMEVLAALQYGDYIISFEEDTPERVIEALKPRLLIKGNGYTLDTIPERVLVESYGGNVILLGSPDTPTSTSIINKIRSVEE